MLASRPWPETQLPFATARDNFYRAARYGLDAAPLALARWPVRAGGELLRANCCRWRAKGWRKLDLAASDIERYLEVISERLRSRQNGAAWQLAHYAAPRLSSG
jgi:hypothetical protein